MPTPKHRHIDPDRRHSSLPSTPKGTPAANKVATHLARRAPLHTATKSLVAGLVLAGLAATTLTTTDSADSTAPDTARASSEVTFAENFRDLPAQVRKPAVSRSMTRRAEVTVDVRVHLIRAAIDRAEVKAAKDAAKQRRIDRAAKRAAVAKAARKAARVAARKEAAAKAKQIAAQEAAAPEPSAATTPGTLRDMGRAEMLKFGFAADQWTYLDQLVMRESGWNPSASNASSGAYGLPQSLPGSKMASEGADWRTNPVTQIRWMLKYIAGRYGTPQNAWAHSQSNGWY